MVLLYNRGVRSADCSGLTSALRCVFWTWIHAKPSQFWGSWPNWAKLLKNLRSAAGSPAAPSYPLIYVNIAEDAADQHRH